MNKVGEWLEKNLYNSGIKKKGDFKPGLSVEGLAKKIGVNASNIYGYMDGTRTCAAKHIPKIAAYLGVPVPTFENDSVEGKTAKQRNVVPVVGTVQAGAFIDIDLYRQDSPREISVVPDQSYPFARQVAYEVRGDSMNLAGIHDGDTIVCVDFQQIGGTLSNGMRVVVEQIRDGLVEHSVKAAMVFDDRVEFQPQSTNHQHKPIVLPNKSRNQHGVEVRVIAVVRSAFRNF